MTSQLYIALMRKLRGSVMCLAYFLTCYPRVFVQAGTGRRPVDGRRYPKAVLYNPMPP